MSPQANHATAQSPIRDSPPLPASRDSPASPEPTPTVVDLSSPTKPPRRPKHEEQKSRAFLSRPSKRTRSEDEKRLTGDYENPADAVRIPDPYSWFLESQIMSSKIPIPMNPCADALKPGANKGYQPVNTLDNVARTTNRKPTTYGKNNRSRLIGQSPGPGQAAYSELQQNKTPTTPSGRKFLRDEEGQRNGSVKRRKINHVINLADDEEDAASAATQSNIFMPGTISHERPRSARSSQSLLSVGSESTATEFKPHQATNEFREVQDLIRPQKKSRQTSCHKIQTKRQTSPFGGGTMSPDARKFILQNFQQGEPSYRPKEHGTTGQPVTSKHFPKARINESTAEQPTTSRVVTVDSPNLRAQHHPAPKQVDWAEGSDSADELAMSPTNTRKQPRSPKAKRTMPTIIKRNGNDKDGSVFWPLSFARSYEWDGTGSKMEDGHATLVLRSDPEGLRVQTYDADGYHRVILIRSQHVNRALADNEGRIRLDGPRDANGNAHIFDLQFLNSSDCLKFCNKYAASLTTRGKVTEKEAEHMRKLFDAPLRPRNDKIRSPEALNNHVQDYEQGERQPGTRAQRSEREIDDNSATVTMQRAPISTRSSRPRLSAPTQISDGEPEICEVSKYSIDTGLGRRWAKALEYGEGRQRAVVHFDDLPRLDEEEYLNDSLIDFYMIYLFRKLKVPAEKVYFFNTYFFTRLTENAGRNSMNYKAVERWTSKIDIFSYDYIVVPINDSQAHWYLAIICNVSNIQRKPVIEDFDQLHPDKEQSETCTTPTVSESGEHTKLPLIQLAESPARAEQVPNQQEEEDPNLFDDPPISLIERDDPGIEARSNAKANESNTVSLDSETEPVEVSRTSAEASKGRLAQPSLSSVKSKNKRKAVPKRDPHQPVVVVLDSLGGVARSGAVRILKDWIAAEGKSKRGMEAIIKENGYYPKGTQIPMQKNWTDCGVYLLGYVEKFFQNPDEFMHKLLTGSMSAADDWPELNPSAMRHKMRDIIFECYKQQEEERKAQKKAKKGPAKPDTSPDPATKQSLPVGDVPAENSPDSKSEEQHEQRVLDDAAEAESAILSPVPRLGSPFEPKKRNAVPAKQSSPGAAAKETDLTVPKKSSVKEASAARSNSPPMSHSPEVCISNTASRANDSIGDGRTSAIGSPDQAKQTEQRGSRSPSLSKRRRDDNDGGPEGSPKAKRLQRDVSLEEKEDDNLRIKAPSAHNREGSAPNAPIEIEDSQEVEVVSSHRVHVRASQIARHMPSSHPPRPLLALHSSSSIEEIPHLSPKADVGQRRAREPSEVDDYDRDHDRRSRAPDPSMSSQTLQETETETNSQDPVEVSRQPTGSMQLDGTGSGDIVRETPEPGRRSPTSA
ncbi:hypothetical protein yc1106_00167 [Curvularia clavata]|uniref:Ubiquitin-like protease family profile domain-containing protein n=1 Tax=Curvularia clavata TaxID=95742 RepID=A0A9Q9DMX2_CURCL|nr:hypothetical protein yc1106_00167 [Curvularia clavata]